MSKAFSLVVGMPFCLRDNLQQYGLLKTQKDLLSVLISLFSDDLSISFRYSQGNFTFYLKEWDPRHREDLSIPEQCLNNFV